MQQRVAETFNRGRILLAGDSTHVNNPIVGMALGGAEAFESTIRCTTLIRHPGARSPGRAFPDHADCSGGPGSEAYLFFGRFRIVIEEVVLPGYRSIFIASLFFVLLSPLYARDQKSAIEAGKGFLESLSMGQYDRYVLHAPPGWKNNVQLQLTYAPEMFEHWRRQINKLESGRGKITTLFFVPHPEMKDSGYVGFQYGAERDRRGLSLLFTDGKWYVVQVGAELPQARGRPSQ